MARFLLTEKQYMNVGDEWEQVETAPTGKQVRHRYKVGTLLDPEDGSLWNSADGIVVSTKEDPAYPRDLVFSGAPNQGMAPLDPEAEHLLRTTSIGVAPMSETAFPTLAVPQASQPDPLAEIKQQLANLAGAVTLLNGENAELKQRLREQEEEPLQPSPTAEEAERPSLL